MNRIYLQIVSICISVVMLAITCNKCQQRQYSASATHGWTPELEKQMYDMFFEQAETFTHDDGAQRSYAVCCVDKMKEMFPKGLGSVGPDMSDSTKAAVMKMGSECVLSLKGKINIWDAETVQQLKLPFYSYPEAKTMSDSARKEYVDCIASTIEAKFPYGLGTGNKDSLKKAINKARTECLKLVGNKYKDVKRISIDSLHEHEFIQQLKLKLYTYPEMKMLPDSLKKEYVDCVASKLVAKFPNGIVEKDKDILKKMLTKSREGCLMLVTDKHGVFKGYRN